MRTVEDLNHRRVELNDLGGGGDSDRRSVQEAEGVASSADRATEWARGAAGGVELEEWLLLAYGRGGYGSRRRGGLRRAAAGCGGPIDSEGKVWRFMLRNLETEPV